MPSYQTIDCKKSLKNFFKFFFCVFFLFSQILSLTNEEQEKIMTKYKNVLETAGSATNKQLYNFWQP